MGHVIKEVAPGSLGEELGLRPGDELVSLCGEKVTDVIDYQALLSGTELTVGFVRGGEEMQVCCEKAEWEELGISFVSSLLTTRTCANRCIFCFIDQMPPGCRPSLYVKDDDWRMSLMMGNFVTLTNVSGRELDRIIRRQASPLYVSVQASDPEVRERMLRNKNAGKLMDQLRKLARAGICFHGQVVLCPGVNDGEVLEGTIRDLAALHPAALSLAVVPVGLTGYREGLYPLQPFDAQGAKEVLERVERWQSHCLKTMDTRFVYAADEFYALAGREMPGAEEYEGFPQIENGVGLYAQLEAEFIPAWRELASVAPAKNPRHVVVATGVSAAPYLRQLLNRHPIPGLSVQVLALNNAYFGGAVTVAGLLTGSDLICQLKDVQADEILITESMLKAGDQLFLDGQTVMDVEKALQVPLHVVSNDGEALARALYGQEGEG